jgi:hypothetical protein
MKYLIFIIAMMLFGYLVVVGGDEPNKEIIAGTVTLVWVIVTGFDWVVEEIKKLQKGE